jgi:hypothetical protein
MNPKAGNYSPDELASLVNDLQARVRSTRREDLGELIDLAQNLAESITAELKIDKTVLEQERARYREEFNFLEHLNPFDKGRQHARKHNVDPIDEEVRRDRAQLTRCCELLEWVRNASQPIEWRTNWHGGIAGVYNEHTGQVEWREAWHTGIAGVYHPDRRCIEWREQWKHGLAGVFNPITREIEWREAWHGGIAGVFNPKTQAVEWRESWHHGVSGIYNPLTETVEWKEAWKSGIAAAWCPRTKSVQWNENWHHGVACIYHDGTHYRSSGSYYGDEDD